jgi:hypothetical protein
VIDITNPQSPRIVGSVSTPYAAWAVAVSGNYACAADGVAGLQMIDITNPANPQIVGNADTPDSAVGVAVSGNYAYVAAWDSGLQILPMQCEPAGIAENTDIIPTLRLRTAPNPASRQTQIRLELPTAGPVRTTIHDVAGRRVRSLEDRIMSAGLHNLLWDGRDDAGRVVVPGIYLARVSTTEGTGTARVVILR